MYRCSSQRKKDFQPQTILVENKCLFTTQSPTMMYGVHAVQLALGDQNTNGNSRCKYHHWNPQNVSLQSIISTCINQFQLSFLVSESLQLSFLESWVTHRPLPKTRVPSRWVARDARLGSSIYMLRSWNEILQQTFCRAWPWQIEATNVSSQQDWDDGPSSGT